MMKVLEPQTQSGLDYARLRESLAMDLSRQVNGLHKQLIHELEQRIDVHGHPAPNNEISNLIHSIADAKMHQMQLELRQHLAARLDVMLADIKHDQDSFERRLQSDLESRLRQLSSHRSPGGWLRRLLKQIPAPDVSVMIYLPISLTLVIMLVMFIMWPT